LLAAAAAAVQKAIKLALVLAVLGGIELLLDFLYQLLVTQSLLVLEALRALLTAVQLVRVAILYFRL
jgi:hypothetical protein